MAKAKRYLKGNGKEWQSGSIGISILATELRGLVNEKGYVNFFISPKKEVGRYGDTHSVYVLDGTADAPPPVEPHPKPTYRPQVSKPVQQDDELPF